MSIFNEEQLKAMFSIDLDDYGREGNEEYENLYPTREEVLGIANDDSEEDSDD